MEAETLLERQDRGFDTTAKLIGLGAFFFGVILLYVVFRMTQAEFQTLESPSPEWAQSAPLNSAPPSDTAPPGEAPAPSPALELGATMGRRSVRVLCLFVLGYLASLIASRGIQLYGAARGKDERETG